MSRSDFERAYNLFKPRKAVAIESQDGAVRVRLATDGSEPAYWYPSLEMQTPVGDTGVLLQVNSEEHVFVPDNLPLAKTPNIYQLRKRMDEVVTVDIPNAVAPEVEAKVGDLLPGEVANQLGDALGAAVSVEVATQVPAVVTGEVALQVPSAIASNPTISGLGVRMDEVEGIASDVNTRIDDVEPSVQLSDTRTYDTRAYPSTQDAIDDCSANGGGTVFLGENELTPQTLTLRDGVYLTGRGIGATTLHVNTIVGNGSVNTLPTIGARVYANDRTVTFASAHGLEPGDVFIIYNTVDGSFNTARPYYRAGEFCKVRTVDSSTKVTVTRPTYDGYRVGADIECYKLVPIRAGVSNMTIECTPGKNGISIEFGSDLEFSNLDLRGTNYTHLNLARCYGVSISKIKAFDYQAEVGLNYGIVIGNSQRIRISDVDLETRRHGLATGHGGGPSVGPARVPVRDLIVSDSRINGLSGDVGVTGCNLHGNSEYVRFDNCTMPSGVNPAGDFISYRNCTIGTPPWGSAVSCMEMLGTTLSFENCHFRATDNHMLVRGMIYLLFPPECVRGGFTKFSGCTVDMGTAVSDGANALAVYVLIQSAAGPVRNLYVNNNIIEASNTINKIGVRIVSDNPGVFTLISYTGNDGRLGGADYLSAASAGTLVYLEGHGSAIPTFAAQRGSTYQRRVMGGTNTGKLYVNENGDTTWRVVTTT